MSSAVTNMPLAASVAVAQSPDMAGPAAADMDKPLSDVPEVDIIEEIFAGSDKREKFIPVTRQALMERLTRPHAWPDGDAQHARRFFRYLDYWRQQRYGASLLELERNYEPFSPDSDLLITRRFRDSERIAMRKRLVEQVKELLTQANFTRIDASQIDIILTPESHYGLDLHVDLGAFEELEIFYRGATKQKGSRRSIRRLYLKKEEFDVPIFQRLFIMFKLKPEEVRIDEIAAQRGCDRESARRLYKRMRALLPPQIKSDFVYLKLFKNMPRSDLEMIFPNTKVRFRPFDKIKFGVTTSGSLGMGVVGTVGKLAVATNPIALAGAVTGLGAIAFRQAMNFINQRNRYMVTMAQNLYFHAMADNRGVMTLLADRAAEEDIKEEILLYSVLAKERVTRSELRDIDAAIEQYLLNTFGINVNFDVDDALSRLMAEGVVTERRDGTLVTLAPADAAHHIDTLWDKYLDELPDQTADAGEEFDDDPRPQA
jgi:hypothetical protein